MSKVLLQFRIHDELKNKLLADSIKNNFPSMTAYLEKLIKIGLPFSDSLETRLQFIEKKVDTNAKNLEMQIKKLFSLLEKINKRLLLIYRINSQILARTFYIKPGNITEHDIEESNRLIEHEVNKILEKTENEDQSS